MTRIDKVFPLVSICIPVYNGEKTILRAVHSAIHQTYPNLEILISDNCSTDNTVRLIASSFPGQANLNLAVRDQNYGMINNFRYAVENARGEYVMTLGADDELPEDAVAELVDRILENRAVAAFGRSNKISGDGKVSIISFGHHGAERELIRAICSEEKINYLICGLWRRDIYQETLKKLAERYALAGTSSDRLFVFFALFNHGINYQLSDKIVYKKYYEKTPPVRSVSFLIRSKLVSIVSAILLIQKNRRKIFLYFRFLPRWIVFQISQAFKSTVRPNVVRALLLSLIKRSIKPEMRQRLKTLFRR